MNLSALYLIIVIGLLLVVILIGVYATNPTVNMFYLGEHELNLFGSMMHRQEDNEAAVEMIAHGKLNLEPLISKHFPFSQFPEACKYIEAQGERTMKVMIEM